MLLQINSMKIVVPDVIVATCAAVIRREAFFRYRRKTCFVIDTSRNEPSMRSLLGNLRPTFLKTMLPVRGSYRVKGFQTASAAQPELPLHKEDEVSCKVRFPIELNQIFPGCEGETLSEPNNSFET